MSSISALALPEAKMLEAIGAARPAKCRTRGMRDAIRKTILQVDPWLVDQVRQVKQQQETLRRIAVMMQPAVALHLKSEGHCE